MFVQPSRNIILLSLNKYGDELAFKLNKKIAK